MEAPRDSLIGQVVGGRYEIVRRIGKGGMGAIYEVRNTRLGRTFALKTLTGDAAKEPEVLSRFRREADAIARLKHAHIVDVIDWESLPDGSPCIIMEHLQGEDLATRIKTDSPLSWAFIARVADQVLSALSVAHRAGIVHRDLKPQNIFLATDDAAEVERAKLLDFGVSKVRDMPNATSDSRIIGTPSYMSPEQAEGRTADIGPATDVWAMGAILYEMVTGEVAFEASGIPQTLYKICSQDVASVTDLRPHTPPALAAVLGRALTRDRAARTPDVDTLRRELRDALRDHVPAMPELHAPRRTPPVGISALTPANPFVATQSGQQSSPADTTLSSLASSTESRRHKRRSPRWIMPGLAVATVAAAVGVFVAARYSHEQAAPRATEAPASQPAPPQPPPSPAHPEPPPPAHPEPPMVAAPIERVSLEIRSVPSGDVFRGDVRLGRTPFTEQIERSSGMRVYVVKRAGYVDQRVELVADVSRSVSINLTRIPKPAPASTASPPAGPCRKKGEPVDPFNKKPPCPT